MADSDKARVIAATMVCRRHLAAARDAIAKLGKAADQADYERARVFLTSARAELAAAQKEVDRARQIVVEQDAQLPTVESCREELDELDREIAQLALSFGQLRD